MEFNLKQVDISEELGVPPLPTPYHCLFKKKEEAKIKTGQSLAMEFESVLDESPAKPTKSSYKVDLSGELDETIRDDNHPMQNFSIKYLKTGIWP
jgi:hypothetical protein